MPGHAYAFRVEPDGTPVSEWLTETCLRGITGYGAEEIDAIAPNALYHPDDQQRAYDDAMKVARGELGTNEYRVITKDGRLRWLQIDRLAVWD